MSSDQDSSSALVLVPSEGSSGSNASPLKRQRVDVDEMDVAEAGFPTAAATATSSPTAPTEHSFSRDLISKATSRVLDDYVGLYERARRELRHREVSFSVAKSHTEKATFPQDLRIAIGTGNPYANYVKNRDELLAHEKEIWEEAKRTILKQRVQTIAHYAQEAKERVANMENVDTFFTFLLQEKFGGLITLPDDFLDEIRKGFYVVITEAKTKLDKLYAELDEKYKAKQAKKAKSTPTTETVDQATFTKALRTEVEDILHNIIDAPSRKKTLEKKSDQVQPSTQRPQQTKKSKRSFAEVVSGQSTSSKRDNSTSSKRDNNTSNKRGKSDQGENKKKKTPPAPQEKKNKHTSGHGTHRRVVVHEDDNDDEDGFTVVKNRRQHQNDRQSRQKNTPSQKSKPHGNSTKNESAQDQRTRPKPRSSHQR